MKMKEPLDKKDLSWREKLNYIWCVLRYSKHVVNWVAMDCECCHYYELERQVHNFVMHDGTYDDILVSDLN